MIVNFLMWICFFINAVYRLYLLNFKRPKQKVVRIVEWIQTFSVISAISTGFLFSIIRFFEPYLIFIIKKEISEWFGILLEEKEDDQSGNDSLSAFLIQSLNVELVNVILKAVAYDEDKYLVDRNGKQTKTPY